MARGGIVGTGAAEQRDAAVSHARELFLDDRNVYGCAETTFLALKKAFGLPDADDSAAAMALNGGVAYSGATCGAVTGAAMALGLLAERRIDDHAAAKRAARVLTAQLMAEFEREHGAVDCRRLLGMDIRTDEQHRTFIESGIWRDRCMSQIEFSVRRLARLADAHEWARALERAGDAGEAGAGPAGEAAGGR
jgi:C_GCAxxG_C_C family probable redox protein